MKTIYVLTPFDTSKRQLSNVKKDVKALVEVDIRPQLWEPEDLNVGFTVEVEDEDAEMVAAAIHRSGDYECFEDVPFWDFKTGQWSPSYAK